MNLVKLLEDKADEIIDEAISSLMQVHLEHYKAAGIELTEQRFKTIYNHTLQCIKDKNLLQMINYVEGIAKERFEAGFDIHEVQMAFFVLEDVIWKKIIKNMKPSNHAEALGLVSTVLGSGKYSLAHTYVTLASKTKSPLMDISVLFRGTDGV